ncbi:hypothetical protein F3K20_19795 [Streptomyces scabiei]|uniref:hypothetical protein n=1 Tax=Streptomyces scabiei TaxID=1930 RepID=UPI001B31431E|nr:MULTISPECIES: hypothetical protein [Streptomyces]MDX3121368.1 hypothetical protein [Streptomyces scabiei]MDX3520460.1 hypothetical protein [Streptomyces scabiei]QTU46793.1 hypothetical protein F3K20_19795 [Streptomyces sp. LBUM 1482]
MARQMPYLVGHAEIAGLFGVERQTSQKWRTEGVLGEPDLVASGNPYWLLGTVLRLDGHNGREVSAERLALYKDSVSGGYALEAAADLPVLLGSKEAALVLGADERAIARWRHRRAIADADLVLSRSPLWLLETIIADASMRGRPVIMEVVEELRAGRRPGQKPRGRKGTSTGPRPESQLG